VPNRHGEFIKVQRHSRKAVFLGNVWGGSVQRAIPKPGIEEFGWSCSKNTVRVSLLPASPLVQPGRQRSHHVSKFKKSAPAKVPEKISNDSK
jgi:hypothetical protein